MAARKKHAPVRQSPEERAAERYADAALDLFLTYRPAPGDPRRDELDAANAALGQARRAHHRAATPATTAHVRAATDAFVAVVRKHCGEIDPRPRTRRHPLHAFMENLRGAGSWWAVLGVTETATPTELRAAYRKLAREHHPDRGGTVDKMAEINGAFARATGRA